MTRLRSAARWCVAPEHRWFVLAVLVGFALRLGWVLWVHAVEPLEATSDAGRNLTMARQFSMLETYRLNGLVSAFNPPGYSFLLTPVAWVSRATGWFEMPLGAALVNVGAGTATVALGGVLGDQWFGPKGRTAAAWTLAVAAGPIFLTVVALTETVFTAVVLAALVLVSRLALRPERSSTRLLVALGGLIGFVSLVRGPGLLLLGIAVPAVRAAAGSWRAAIRPASTVLAVTVAVLVPWTVRNAIQVGTYTPVATNSAAFLCQGHGEHARADVEDMTEADFAECFRGSPFDPRDPDEAAWASRISRRAVAWAVRHPVEEVELTWDKTYATLANDHQALADAADGARRELTTPDTLERLDRFGEYWHRAVLALGLLGLLLTPTVRRAWPLWVGAGGFVAVVWVGNALDRYHHTTMALLAVMAAGFLVSLPESRPGVWAIARARDDRRRRSRQLALAAATRLPGPPPPPVDGLAQAAHPAVPVLDVAGVPVHPWLASVAVAAWLASVGFDLMSQVADQAWAYARGAFVLTGVGVLGGIAAAVAGTLDLRSVPRGTVARRTGRCHLLAMDACLALFGLSFLLRRSSSFAVHEGVALLPMICSGVGVVLLAFGVWWGTTLAHTHGVRVAHGSARRRGFGSDADDVA